MKTRWRHLSSTKKAVALCATLLMLSVGLCGVNGAIFAHYKLPVSGPSVPGQERTEQLAMFLIMTGSLEALAIAGSALGLVVSLLVLLINSISRPGNPR